MLRQMKKLNVLICAAVLAVLTSEPAAASDKATIIIAPASRAMTGRIKGGASLSPFRDAALKALDVLPPEEMAGLIAYGEAPPRKCEDVSDLTPLSRVADARPALKNSLQKLQPKGGRAPQIAAMARAAELLKAQAGAGQKAIVLVAGSADDCAEDACAAAKAFQIANPGVPVHVVALSPAKTERGRLQCIADQTGGMYAEAADAASVLPQLIAALQRDKPSIAPEDAALPTPQANAADAPIFETPPLPERNPSAQTAAIAPKLEPNVVMRAILSAGSSPLRQGVAWRVFAAKTGAKTVADYDGAKPVWTGAGAEPSTTLAPGRYYVHAAYGFVSKGLDIDVTSGAPVDATVTLDAGAIEAQAVAKAGGAPLDQMFYILYADEPGKPREIGRSSRSDAVFHVPAGRYRIVAQHGLAEAQTSVSVEAGNTARAALVMNSGLLKVEARIKPGGPVMQQVFYYIYSGEDKDGREIARSASPEPLFQLASGKYRVVAQYDLAKAEKIVTVAADQKSEANFVMDGAGLKLSSKLAGQTAPLTRDIQYTLYKLNRDGVEATEEIGRYASLNREIFLRSGRYRIESKYGYQNAVQAAEISLSPGENRELVIEQRAGEVKLTLVAKPGGLPLARVRWSLSDEAGAVVLTTTQALPQLVLKSGKYRATAQYGSKDFTGDFEVADNESKTVEITTK